MLGHVSESWRADVVFQWVKIYVMGRDILYALSLLIGQAQASHVVRNMIANHIMNVASFWTCHLMYLKELHIYGVGKHRSYNADYFEHASYLAKKYTHHEDYLRTHRGIQ